MHAHHLALIVLAAGAGPTTATAAPAAPAAPFAGKAQAPVTIAIAAERHGAEITITFQTAGDAVEVAVTGVGGLIVDPAGTVLQGATVAAGEVRHLAIRVAGSPATGDLAVFVRGRFNGQIRHRVVSHRFGEGSADATAGPPVARRRALATPGPEGRREIVLPAVRR